MWQRGCRRTVPPLKLWKKKDKEIDAEKEWALDEFGPRENPGYDVKFGSFLANPLNAAKVRYVRCDIVFTVSDADLFATTGLEQARARAAAGERGRARARAAAGERGL